MKPTNRPDRPPRQRTANDNVMRPGGTLRPGMTLSPGGVHPGGAYERDTFRREFYTDPKSMLYFIDRLRFSRAICGRETTMKPSKSNIVARTLGNRLYPIVVDSLKGPDKDLYRLHGLGCVYGDLHRLSRRLLIPMIDKWIAERRDHAIVPDEFIEMLTDAIRDRLWREYGDIKRVA